jgi:3-phosphoshikimate 1-carboxyvinyltransferase
MSQPRPLVVHPGAPLAGGFTPPGDKSVTHRAILFGLLAEGVTRVVAPNPGADCDGSARCAATLGARVTRDGDAWTLAGCPERFVGERFDLDCGNSGTTLRLLAGLVAARPVSVTLAGDASLNRRPVARVIEPLRRMGAHCEAAGGDRTPPLTVHGGALHGIEYAVPVASAQVATAVLLAGLGAAGTTRVTLPGPARDHTERMLPAFGAPLTVRELPHGGREISLEGPRRLRACEVRVPGDASAAAFFLAAAAATPGARVTARGMNVNPTRTGLLDVLRAMGAPVTLEAERLEAGEPVADVTVEGPARLRAFDVPAEWVARLIDEVPAWVVAATAADGVSRLTGAAELRVKESDRLAALARNLARLGVRCEELPDGLAIGGGPVGGGTVESLDDHRIAMAFAVLGTRATGAITVDDARAVATSFPGFAATLTALGGQVEGTTEGGA